MIRHIKIKDKNERLKTWKSNSFNDVVVKKKYISKVSEYVYLQFKRKLNGFILQSKSRIKLPNLSHFKEIVQ